ncbi:MAG: CAP domain-containing protein, partial [Tepidiformaceae bacterium]
ANMAVFDGARPAVIIQAARELRVSRYAPLSLAGIVAGAAVALGLTFSSGDDATAPADSALPAAFAAAAAAFVDPPSLPLGTAAVIPTGPAAGIHIQQAVALPSEYGAFWSPVPSLPALPEVATADAPAPAAAPQPITPAPAPAGRAQQPVSAVVVQPPAPAPAPVVQPPAPVPTPVPVAEEPAPPPAAGPPNFYLPDVPGGGATSLEQRLVNGINAERTAAGLAPYAYDTGLAHIARIRSRQMADQQYFGHVDPYGYAMYTELLAYFGYGYAWAGENIALNNYSAGESAERALISLMNSPSHRANILAGDFSRIGVGEVSLSDGRHYYTMIFLG